MQSYGGGRSKTSIHLELPFYRQHYDFTCGPTSLMMVMKYFDKKIKLTRELEMDIWREANMLESYGTSRYGLAFSAATRGFSVRIYANIKGPGFIRKIESIVGKVDQRLLRFFLEDRKKRSFELGAKEKFVEKISGYLLRKTLESGYIPLVLSNAEYFGAEDIPHWVVVAGIDNRWLYSYNPLRKGHRKISLDSLEQVLGYKGDQCMLAISKAE
jgi:hypothetical protein